MRPLIANACTGVLASILALSLSSAANAQARQGDQRGAPEGWTLDVGVGILTAPLYRGDDEYQIAAPPFLRVGYGDVFFASVQDGIGYRLINTAGWKVGPIAAYDFGREEEDGGNPFRLSGDDPEDLIGFGDLDGTFEIGGFVERVMGPWTAELEIRQATGGHEGLVGEAGISYRTRIQRNGPPMFLSVGPRIDFGDADFTQAYFGVTPEQATATGLDAFEADGGITSYGIGGAVVMPLTQGLFVTGVVGVDRLTGDAADSPLVQERGSETQGFGGLFVSYRFQ